MPLPWKKNGVTRISQIVADFQTPKRGGSLVVQTGFPTSLVDLFVKNRDRLRKPSKKHKKKKNMNGSDDRVTDPISTTSDMGSSHSTISVRPSSPKVENLIPKEGDHGVEEGDHGIEESGFRLSAEMGETHVENRVVDAEKCVGGGDWSVGLLSVLKVFAVVVLALSTKRLAVGITLSAFLLMFLEFVGKHLVCRLKPCSKPKAALQSVAPRVSASPLVLKGVDESEDKKREIVQERTEAVLFDLLDIGVESDSSNEEPNNNSGRDCIDRTASQVTLLEFLSADDKKWKVVGDGEESKGGKIKFSKSAKIKAKLVKKFVSKKLRRKSKKHGAEPFSDVSSYTGDDEAEGSEEQQDQKDAILEEQDDRKDSIQEEQESENMSLLSLNAEEKCEKQGVDGVSDRGSETSLIVEKKEGGRKGNFGYLILFLVVLTGLFGGRIVALVLTIPCCFMLELLED